MLVNEKANLVLDYLKLHKKATIEELSKAIFASESTVRRSLVDLQNSGLIARYHGGAILLEDTRETSLFVRTERNIIDKTQCANIALNCLPNFSTVFIDNSSTCLTLAKKMDFTNKTVITNGLQIALQLSAKQNIQLIVPGGMVHLNTNAITGSLAIKFLEMLNIDLMLSSCAAISHNGAYELSLETAQLKNTVMNRSKHKVLIATQNKFQNEAPYLVSTLDKYDCIITNACDGDLRIIDPDYNLKNIVNK